MDSQLGDVGTVALHLLHEEEDVVDVHLHLLHQLHLKLDVVVDVGLVVALCVLLCPVSQREVDARIVLQVSLAEGVLLGKLVETGKQVSYLQDAAEELDESLLVRIGKRHLAWLCQLSQLFEIFGIAFYVLLSLLAVFFFRHLVVAIEVVFEWAQDAHALGGRVAEEGETLVGGILQIAEAYDVAVGLYRVQDAVGAAVGLQ